MGKLTFWPFSLDNVVFPNLPPFCLSLFHFPHVWDSPAKLRKQIVHYEKSLDTENTLGHCYG